MVSNRLNKNLSQFLELRDPFWERELFSRFTNIPFQIILGIKSLLNGLQNVCRTQYDTFSEHYYCKFSQCTSMKFSQCTSL